APGTQSLTDELVLGLERVSVWRPMIAPVALKAVSGKDASREAGPFVAHVLKLQLCCALPTTVNRLVARSWTSTVVMPLESKMTQARWSGVRSRFASTAIEKPVLASEFWLLASVTSQ